MRDRLLFTTIGLLVGIVAMQWTMPSGQASIVDSSVSAGSVVGVATEGFIFSILTSDGSIYWISESGFEFKLSIPIPVSDVAFYCGDDEGLIAKNGDVWKVTNAQGQNWVNLGPAPGDPVPTQGKSWGKIKNQYGGKN